PRQKSDLFSDHSPGLLSTWRRAGVDGDCADVRDAQRGLFVWRGRLSNLQSVHNPAERVGDLDQRSFSKQSDSEKPVRSRGTEVSREQPFHSAESTRNPNRDGAPAESHS